MRPKVDSAHDSRRSRGHLQQGCRGRPGFFRDVLKYESVDAGHGWLIFALPPAEVAVHPSDANDVHELFLMCDDIQALVAEMKRKDVECSPVDEQRWGSITRLTLPAAGSSASTSRARLAAHPTRRRPGRPCPRVNSPPIHGRLHPNSDSGVMRESKPHARDRRPPKAIPFQGAAATTTQQATRRGQLMPRRSPDRTRPALNPRQAELLPRT